jgi:PGF-pre-PGF domain-containing protein
MGFVLLLVLFFVTPASAAPNTTITSNPPSVSNSANAAFTFTSTEPGTFECQLDTSGYSACTNPKEYTGLTDGSHTFYVQAIDDADNADPSPAAYTWTVDAAELIVITITSPDNNSVNDTGFINVTVTLNRDGNVTLNWEGSNESMVGEGKHFYKNKTGLLSGNYSFRVYANDSNGISNASETIIITVNRTIIDDTIGHFINTSTFIVNTTLEIAAPGGNTTLIIPNGTNASVAGAPVMSISVDSAAKIESTFAARLAGNDKFIGENVTFGPSGAVFDPPVQIRFNYTDVQIAAAGISESDLKVKYYNTTSDNWESLTIFEQNTTGNYLIVNISHFSKVALIGTAVTATTPPPSSSGGSSGGGGGGGTSGENFTNIIVKEKYDLQIYKDIVTSYKFTNVNNPILSINIVGNVNAGEIGTAVEVLRNTSSLVKTPAPGNVYKNVNVWVGTSGFSSPKNIKEAVITFRVENSWISSNNMKSSGIKMVRWDGSKWDQLETSEKTKDSTYIYFEAKTDSFSSFAITGIDKEYITENAVIIEPTEPAAAIQPDEKKYDFLTNWFLIIGVFFAIGLIIEMYLRMKKK